MKPFFELLELFAPYPRRKVTVIVEVCAGLSHGKAVLLSTFFYCVANGRSRCFGQSERSRSPPYWQSCNNYNRKDRVFLSYLN